MPLLSRRLRIHRLPPTHIFHITDFRNLRQIIASGEILSKAEIERRKTSYKNIAYDGLQATTIVPCGPGGVLHDYVPFYFAPRSPMLLAIHKGLIEGYTHGQESIIYLVSTAQIVDQANRKFAFTDGHGIMTITDFFDDLRNLEQVDWAIMKEKYWANTEEDGDRKRRRQAEFLIHASCPWNLIKDIVVIDKQTAEAVLELVSEADHKPHVGVRPNWYYE